MNSQWKTNSLICLLKMKRTIMIQCKNKRRSNLKRKRRDSMKCLMRSIRMISTTRIKRREPSRSKSRLTFLREARDLTKHLNLKEFIRQKVFVNDCEY